MSRTKKILLGVLAFFPIGYIIFFVAFIGIFMLSMFTTISTASTSPTGRPPDPFPMMAPFFALFGLHFLAMLGILAQIGVYLVLLFRNLSLRDNERIAWVVAILLAGWIATPIYWYLHVWKAPDEETPPLPG